MANKNFEVKHGLSVGGTERISTAGVITGSHAGSIASSTTATTQSALDNSTKIATTAYTDAAITALIDSSPGTLNTLNELAAALGDDANFSTTVTNSLGTKLNLSGGTLTGGLAISYTNPILSLTTPWSTGNYGQIRLGYTAGTERSITGHYDNGLEFKVNSNTMSYNTSGALTVPSTITSNSGMVEAGSSSAMQLQKSGTSGYINMPDSGNMYFRIGSGFANPMTIKSNEMVGIGTSNPSAKLDVVTNDTVWATEITQSNTSNGDGLNVTIGSTSSADYALSIRPDAGNTPGLNVKGDGKVGVGTFSPAWKFTVEGSASDDWISRIYNTASDGVGLLVRTDATTASDKMVLGVYADNNYRMAVKSNGKVGINTTTPEHDLHVYTAGQNQDGILKIGGSSSGLGMELRYDQSGVTTSHLVVNPTYTNANSIFHICVDGDANPNQLVLKGNGKVGIGTDNPASTAMLHVGGGIRFDTNPWADGTAMNVISSNVYTNMNTFNSITSIYYKMGIIDIYHTDGHSQLLFIANGGSGVGFQFSFLRPDTGTVYNNTGVDFTFTAQGDGGEQFRIQVTSGGGALSISHTGGTSNSSWGVFVSILMA